MNAEIYVIPESDDETFDGLLDEEEGWFGLTADYIGDNFKNNTDLRIFKLIF
jgi:hypothetical protein